MRNQNPTFRSLLSLTVLAGIGLSGLLFPWAWAQLTAIALVVVLVLIMVARNALRRASRRIDAILEEELGNEPDSEPAPVVRRLAS